MKTISLENAKKLKGLGITKDGYFIYACLRDIDTLLIIYPVNRIPFTGVDVHEGHMSCEIAKAYTADEIGDMIPDECWVQKKKGCYLACCPMVDAETSDTMADAMALMLIHLIENGHIAVKEINK